MKEIDTKQKLILQKCDDYVQSANTLFHFMQRHEYLSALLKRRALVPRYCQENIAYLNLEIGGHPFDEIYVLQKCFCDIPFHKLTEAFEISSDEDALQTFDTADRLAFERSNTHPAYYGRYAIALSKQWGESHGLQPVQYANGMSDFTNSLSEVINSAYEADDLPDLYVNDILRRLSFIKPLRGLMRRRFRDTWINVQKNFHDEREWRFVPPQSALDALQFDSVIANPTKLRKMEGLAGLNRYLEREAARPAWLEFSFDDIRYLIVPTIQARIELIKEILALPPEGFSTSESENIGKSVLISKILVLDEIRKDWYPPPAGLCILAGRPRMTERPALREVPAASRPAPLYPAFPALHRKAPRTARWSAQAAPANPLS